MEGRLLVSLKDDNEELGKDIAMHVTASNPKFLSPEDVDSETIEKEKQILKAQVEDTNKPEEIIEKMIEGRLNKFLSEISLLKQPFVKDPSTSIENILNDHKNSIVEFTRIEVGEGIEVEQKDFASSPSTTPKFLNGISKTRSSKAQWRVVCWEKGKRF